MKSKTDEYLKVFYSSFSEYKTIGEADALSEHERKSQKFKALDMKSGNILLVSHPDAWETKTDFEGREYKIRPIPIILSTHDDAKGQRNYSKSKDVLNESFKGAGF